MEEGTTALTRMLGGPILLDLRHRSQRRNRCNLTLSAPQCTLKLEQGQEQERLLVVELSNVTSSHVQIEPLDEAPEIPLDLKPSRSLAPKQSLEPSLPLSPPVVL